MTRKSMAQYDVGIIGAGVAGSFAALRIAEKHKNIKAVLIDIGRPPQKRRRQLEGWLGCFPTSDGKLYPNDLDLVKELVDGRKVRPANNWVVDYLKMSGPMKLTKDKKPSSSIRKKMDDLGYEFVLNNYYQWKPESVHKLSKIMSTTIEEAGNIAFSFDNEAVSLIKKNGKFVISTRSGDITCEKVILCVGRSGWRWVTQLYDQFGIIDNNDYATYGVRFEIPSSYLGDFNRSHCTIYTEDLEIGPFSWGGTVIPEDHSDLVISSFRSNEGRWKTEKVSFSMLKSIYMPDAGCKQSDRIGKLSFLLFNDRIGREKVKTFMSGNSSLSLLPEYKWLSQAVERVEELVPDIINKGSFHVPNILPLAAQIRIGTNLESEVENMFVAGESAGIRGIMAAATMGAVAGDSVAK